MSGGRPRSAAAKRAAAKAERLEALGLLTAPLGNECAVYDLTTDEVSIIHPLAGLVLETEPQDWNGLIGQLYESAPGATREQLAEQIQSAADDLAAAGLLRERIDAMPTKPPASTTPPHPGDDRTDWHTGATLTLVDSKIAFRGPDAGLIARVEALVPLQHSERDADIVIEVVADAPDPGGATLTVRADSDTEWHYGSFDELATRLPGVLEELVVATAHVPLLHGGAVRTPAEAIIVVPGPVGSGTSTLVAALVQAGCDLIGDRVVGIRPGTRYAVGVPLDPVLDATSLATLGLSGRRPDGSARGRDTRVASPAPDERVAPSPATVPTASMRAVPTEELRAGTQRLAGNVGRIDGIAVARFDAHADGVTVTPTSAASEALEALLPAATDIVRWGTEGWRTLCKVCSEVPVVTMIHADATLAAARILGA